jgi:hypothetical protein
MVDAGIEYKVLCLYQFGNTFHRKNPFTVVLLHIGDNEILISVGNALPWGEVHI